MMSSINGPDLGARFAILDGAGFRHHAPTDVGYQEKHIHFGFAAVKWPTRFAPQSVPLEAISGPPKTSSNGRLFTMASAVRNKTSVAGADVYDQARRKLVPCFDDFYRAALDLLPFAPEARFEVLDLGAGTGLLSAMIAEMFPKAQLTLFDLTPEMLTIARQRLKPLGQRAIRNRRLRRRRGREVLRYGGVGLGAAPSAR